MVDTTKAIEGQYVTVDLVRNSPSKCLVVLGEGGFEETDYGTKLTIPVEIDGKKKDWRLNKDSAKNMQNCGIDSKGWVGIKVKLQIVSISGKDAIVGVPTLSETITEAVQ